MQNNIQSITFGARLVFKLPNTKLKDSVAVGNAAKSVSTTKSKTITNPSNLQKFLFGIRKKIKLPTLER